MKLGFDMAAWQAERRKRVRKMWIIELADSAGCRLECDDDEGKLFTVWRDDQPSVFEVTSGEVEAWLVREIRLRHGPFN
jgi:hypothetical protein